MANRSVSVELKAQVSSYIAGIKRAQQATQEFAGKGTRAVQAHSAELGAMGTAMALSGAVVTLGVAKIVASYAEFDRAMVAQLRGYLLDERRKLAADRP